MQRGDFWFDVAWGFVLLVLSSVVWWSVDQLPPPIFDPVGSAAVPKATAGVIIVLSFFLFASAWKKIGKNDTQSPEATSAKPVFGVAILILLVAYAALLPVLHFALATFLFVSITGGLLSQGRKGVLLAVLLCALVLSVCSQYLFTHVFYIDLP